MTRDELEIIWHDWLRGVLVIGMAVVMVVVYLTGLLPAPVFATVMVCVFCAATMVLAASSCIGSLCPAGVRAASTLVSLVASASLVLTAWQVHFPAPAPGEIVLSPVQPDGTLTVPESAGNELYVVIRGNPGSSPSGNDSEVAASVTLAGAVTAGPLSVTLLHHRSGGQGGQSKGLSISRRTADVFRVAASGAGQATVHLDRMRPENAMPLHVSLHAARVSPTLLTALSGLTLLVSLVLAFFSWKRSVFPGAVPLAAVLLTVQFFVARGYCPTEPVLPLLGILTLTTIPAALVGWILSKAVERMAGPPRTTTAKKGSR
jgi:hypothetical protein